MALIKSIPTDFGISAEYWNIGAVQEDFKGQGTEVTFYGYATEQARQEARQPQGPGSAVPGVRAPELELGAYTEPYDTT